MRCMNVAAQHTLSACDSWAATAQPGPIREADACELQQLYTSATRRAAGVGLLSCRLEKSNSAK